MKTKHFAFLLLSLSIAFHAARGQGVVNGGAISSNAEPFGHHLAPAPSAPFSTLSSDEAISYFDPSTPTHGWLIPLTWANSELMGITERITLPTDSGYVDSVRIVFNAISGDSVSVALDPDSVVLQIYPIGLHEHLDATVFNPALNAFGHAVIYPPQLRSDTVTVPFPHVMVPKNFHVVLAPSITSSFAIRGDSEATRARTLDNCHSTIIALNGNQTISNVIDSNLTPVGYTAPAFSNLYITAYVSSAPSSVAATNASSTISIFPNPVSSSLRIQDGEAISRVDLFDLLGRTVLSQKLDGSGTLDVSGLEPGRYEAIIHTARGISTAPVLIRH